jgi:hypothetical protein
VSRARDMANLGSQAGSGLDASDITTGTLGNTVQDNITRLGVVTNGTSATFPFDGSTDAGRIIQVKGISSRESNALVGTWTVRWNYSITLKSSSSRIMVLHTENSYVGNSSGYGVKVYRNNSVYNDSVTTITGTVVYDKIPLNSSGLSHMIYSQTDAMYTINPINFMDDVSSSFNAGDTVYYGHYYSEYSGASEVPAGGNASDHAGFTTIIMELVK